MKLSEKIREIIGVYKLKKLYNPLRERSYIDWDHINSLLILYFINVETEAEAESICKALHSITDKNNIDKYNVKTVVCFKKNKVESSSIDFYTFDYKKGNIITRTPSKDVFDFVLDADSDVLINLSPNICYPIEYLAEQSNAKLKISVNKGAKGAKYDMYFTTEESEIVEVFNSIKYYLQKIKAE